MLDSYIDHGLYEDSETDQVHFFFFDFLSCLGYMPMLPHSTLFCPLLYNSRLRITISWRKRVSTYEGLEKLRILDKKIKLSWIRPVRHFYLLGQMELHHWDAVFAFSSG